MTEYTEAEVLETETDAEAVEEEVQPSQYELFCQRCDTEGVTEKPTKRMYTRWASGNVRAELKRLNLEQIEDRHISYWLDKATEAEDEETFE